MRKITLLLTIVALIQIPALSADRCNLDAKGNGFEIQNTSFTLIQASTLELQPWNTYLFQASTLETESPHIRIVNPDSPDFGITNPEEQKYFDSKESKYDTVQIQTSAVCKMCKERIEHDMAFEKGVTTVELDMETKILTIVYKKGKTTEKDLREAVTEIGYDADDLVADQKAHDRLPACCQKDVEPH